MKILELKEIQEILTDDLLKAFVNGGDIGFFEDDGKPLIGSNTVKMLILVEIYRMVRELYENRHEKTCQSDQHACDRNGE